MGFNLEDPPNPRKGRTSAPLFVTAASSDCHDDQNFVSFSKLMQCHKHENLGVFLFIIAN